MGPDQVGEIKEPGPADLVLEQLRDPEHALEYQQGVAGDRPPKPGTLGDLLAADQPQLHARYVEADRRVVLQSACG